jgi:hypothetical protein
MLYHKNILNPEQADVTNKRLVSRCFETRLNDPGIRIQAFLHTGFLQENIEETLRMSIFFAVSYPESGFHSKQTQRNPDSIRIPIRNKNSPGGAAGIHGNPQIPSVILASVQRIHRILGVSPIVEPETPKPTDFRVPNM